MKTKLIIAVCAGLSGVGLGIAIQRMSTKKDIADLKDTLDYFREKSEVLKDEVLALREHLKDVEYVDVGGEVEVETDEDGDTVKRLFPEKPEIITTNIFDLEEAEDAPKSDFFRVEEVAVSEVKNFLNNTEGDWVKETLVYSISEDMFFLMTDGSFVQIPTPDVKDAISEDFINNIVEFEEPIIVANNIRKILYDVEIVDALYEEDEETEYIDEITYEDEHPQKKSSTFDDSE